MWFSLLCTREQIYILLKTELWETPFREKIFINLCFTLPVYGKPWFFFFLEGLVAFVWCHLLCVTILYATCSPTATADKWIVLVSTLSAGRFACVQINVHPLSHYTEDRRHFPALLIECNIQKQLNSLSVHTYNFHLCGHCCAGVISWMWFWFLYLKYP